MDTVKDYYGSTHISSPFGDGRTGGRKHRGTDFSHSTRPGTVPIPALLDGKVVAKLAPASWHGFGHQVTIESTWAGVTVRFSWGHLSKASPLKVGQKVKAGDLVGYEGNTGSTLGSCTHIELLRGGKYIDPAPTIAAIRKAAGKPAPAAVKPKPKPSTVKAPKFPLARGEFFGPEGRGANSVSGWHSHRADLRRWQQRMHDRGWAITVDGLFSAKGVTKFEDSQTGRILAAFQKEKHLAGGGIGPESWAAAWEEPVT